MSDADRVRGLLAEAAAIGHGAGRLAGGEALRVVLQAVDGTILPRRLEIAPQGTAPATGTQATPGTLRLIAAERRLLELIGPAPKGLAAGDADLFDRPLAFDDAALPVSVARILAAWAATVAGATLRVTADRLPDAAGQTGGTGMAGTGLGTAALAQALGLRVWPDRSLAARLEAWMPEAWRLALAGTGFGALGDGTVVHGDAAAMAAFDATCLHLAPEGLPAVLSGALSGDPSGGAGHAPAGRAPGAVSPGLVVLAGTEGRALVVAGAPEAGLAALVPDAAVAPLLRAWQGA